jgi:ribosome maturation factor RimP
VARLYIERAAGAEDAGPNDAGIDECAHASRLIGLAMEVEDFIPSAYVLEVSTPGLERRFFKPVQLAAAQGRQVEITLAEAVDQSGRKKYTGLLAGARIAENGDWLFDLDVDEPAADESAGLAFPWSKVKKARQLYDPPPKPKPGEKPGGKTAAQPGRKPAGAKNG